MSLASTAALGFLGRYSAGSMLAARTLSGPAPAESSGRTVLPTSAAAAADQGPDRTATATRATRDAMSREDAVSAPATRRRPLLSPRLSIVIPIPSIQPRPGGAVARAQAFGASAGRGHRLPSCEPGTT